MTTNDPIVALREDYVSVYKTAPKLSARQLKDILDNNDFEDDAVLWANAVREKEIELELVPEEEPSATADEIGGREVVKRTRGASFSDKLEKDKAAWEELEEAHVSKAKATMYFLVFSDTLIRLYGEQTIVRDWPDMDTASRSVIEASKATVPPRMDDNNPRWYHMHVSGKDKPVKRDWIDDLLDNTEQVIQINADVKKYGEQVSNRQENTFGGNKADVRGDMEMQRSKRTDYKSTIVNAVNYLKAKAAFNEFAGKDKVTMIEKREPTRGNKKGKWILKKSPILLFDADDPGSHKYFSGQRFATINFDAAEEKYNEALEAAEKTGAEALSYYRAILKTLERKPKESERQTFPKLDDKNYSEGFSELHAFLDRFEGPRAIHRLLKGKPDDGKADLMKSLVFIYDKLHPFIGMEVTIGAGVKGKKSETMTVRDWASELSGKGDAQQRNV